MNDDQRTILFRKSGVGKQKNRIISNQNINYFIYIKYVLIYKTTKFGCKYAISETGFSTIR